MMKISLKLRSDSYNSSCEGQMIDFEVDGDDGNKTEYVRVTLGDREVTVSRDEIKKTLAIL